jgi:hypothetical protein
MGKDPEAEKLKEVGENQHGLGAEQNREGRENVEIEQEPSSFLPPSQLSSFLPPSLHLSILPFFLSLPSFFCIFTLFLLT